MMPLCTTASFPLAWGWALFSVGRPWVAQRVWPMPTEPLSGSSREQRLEIAQLALGAAALQPAVLQRGHAGGIIAAIFQPPKASTSSPATGPWPRMPTIPHI